MTSYPTGYRNQAMVTTASHLCDSLYKLLHETFTLKFPTLGQKTFDCKRHRQLLLYSPILQVTHTS